MKIVINKSTYGQFGVTKAVYDELGFEWLGYGELYETDLYKNNKTGYRGDPQLIAAIEKIGLTNAAQPMCVLKIVEIPDDIDWEIQKRNRTECVCEKPRCWG